MEVHTRGTCGGSGTRGFFITKTDVPSDVTTLSSTVRFRSSTDERGLRDSRPSSTKVYCLWGPGPGDLRPPKRRRENLLHPTGTLDRFPLFLHLFHNLLPSVCMIVIGPDVPTSKVDMKEDKPQ